MTEKNTDKEYYLGKLYIEEVRNTILKELIEKQDKTILDLHQEIIDLELELQNG